MKYSMRRIIDSIYVKCCEWYIKKGVRPLVWNDHVEDNEWSEYPEYPFHNGHENLMYYAPLYIYDEVELLEKRQEAIDWLNNTMTS